MQMLLDSGSVASVCSGLHPALMIIHQFQRLYEYLCKPISNC